MNEGRRKRVRESDENRKGSGYMEGAWGESVRWRGCSRIGP